LGNHQSSPEKNKEEKQGEYGANKTYFFPQDGIYVIGVSAGKKEKFLGAFSDTYPE
jgi:hypothetical protein